MVGSALAGLWKFLTGDDSNRQAELLRRVSSLIERARKATTAGELTEIDRDSDEVVSDYLAAQVNGLIDSDDAAQINMLVQYLESTIERRNRALGPSQRLAGG